MKRVDGRAETTIGREEFVHQLAWAMALRGASDQQIIDAVGEARVIASEGGDPGAELGEPEEYARSLPRLRRRTTGVRTMKTAALLGAGWVIAYGLIVAMAGFVWSGLSLVVGELGGFRITLCVRSVGTLFEV